MSYRFKDNYFNIKGTDVQKFYTTKFYSYLGNGDGSKTSPGNAADIIETSAGAIIISGGRFRSSILITKGSKAETFTIGQGIGETTIYGTLNARGVSNVGRDEPNKCYYKDITFEDLILVSSSTWAGLGSNIFNNCEFTKVPSYQGAYDKHSFTDNIFHFIPTSPMTNVTGKNTFFQAKGTPLNLSAQLYHRCYITLSAHDIKNLENNFTAFNDCWFKIGLEEDFYPLEGNNAAELRQSFVERCKIENIELINHTESGETLAQGRWIFTKDSVIGYTPYKNSEIYQFEVTRQWPLYFGVNKDRFDLIAVTEKKNKPNTFVSDHASKELLLEENSISLGKEIDITDTNHYSVVSKINWLGGIKQINKINIYNTFPKNYGVLIDSTHNLDLANPILSGENKIEEGEWYFIRSADKEEAAISYNEKELNTDITSLGNRFQGIAGLTTYQKERGNPIVYKLKDKLQYYTIQMRVVNQIPPEKILSGYLRAGYWYLIEHDKSQSKSTDYIKYNNTDYYVGDSFLVLEDNATFERHGDIHLRRCWKEDYNENDINDLDYSFWKDIQKPKWFDVIPNDPRCLGEGNTPLFDKMQTDNNGNYIASGHPLFYNELSGTKSYILPSYNIKGAFQQFKLIISTQNLINVI